MKVKLFFIALLVLSFNVGFSQTFTKRDLKFFSTKIDSFISDRDYSYNEGRQSEFVHLIFKTDSKGFVSNICTAGNETDSLYKLIKKMTPDYLKGWKGPKDKLIILPYFYFSYIKSYVDTLFKDFYQKIPEKQIIKESGNVILIRWLFSSVPPPPTEVRGVDR